MSRGKVEPIGTERVAPNGYHYVKVKTEHGTAWKLKHHIIMEETLGRSLRDGERVVFKDGKRSNLRADNIAVKEKGRGSVQRRKAQIEARIAELQAELHELEMSNG